MYYTVNVVYQGNLDYKNLFTYKVSSSLNLKVGDLIIVPVLNDLHFKVAKVVEVVRQDPHKIRNLKWVVQKLDLSEYRKLLAKDEN